MGACRRLLPGPLAHLEPLLGHYGYWAVGAVVLVEDFGVPAPGETILLAAGVYAGAGRLNVAAVALIAFAAAVAGDNLGYLIGRSGGRAFVHRWGRYVFLTPKRFEAAEGFFTRHGGKIVTVARFVEGCARPTASSRALPACAGTASSRSTPSARPCGSACGPPWPTWPQPHHRDLRRDQALPAVRRPRRRRGDRGVRRTPPRTAAARPLIRLRVWTAAQRQSGGGPQTASEVGK
ncbi:DedA family protein [Streptomyces nogalater]